MTSNIGKVEGLKALDLKPPNREELKLARNTARNHVASLYQKIGVNRRSALIVWARERGIGSDGVAAKLSRGRKAGARKPSQIVRNNQPK